MILLKLTYVGIVSNYVHVHMYCMYLCIIHICMCIPCMYVYSMYVCVFHVCMCMCIPCMYVYVYSMYVCACVCIYVRNRTKENLKMFLLRCHFFEFRMAAAVKMHNSKSFQKLNEEER
jgi:hypothetical protein